jgi:putative colanic acid biosynthesis acetyltransferase WcaF
VHTYSALETGGRAITVSKSHASPYSNNKSDAGTMIYLDRYDNSSFDRGRSKWQEMLWLLVQWLLVSSWIPGATHRRLMLRLFGARIGKSVNIKPRVRVKFPWRLAIGDHTWIGEDVWIDNLADVTIGSHCCISQGAYLCTGSHDWATPDFALIVKPIRIENQAWIAARSVIGPGVSVGEGSVLSLASLASDNLPAWSICAGVPATVVKGRCVRDRSADS